jgi:S-adenosylmethionine uptake transporter
MLFGFATFLIFSCGDAVIKYETRSFPMMECAFFAEIGAIAALALLCLRDGGFRKALASKSPRIQFLRALCIGAEFLLVLYGFSRMPMATVYTLVLSSPLLTVFFAPVFTSDRFNPRLLPAIFAGFAGVLIALRPDAMPVGLPALSVLCGAFFFAFGSFIVRRMEKDEPPLTFAFFPSLFTFAVTVLYMTVQRPPMPGAADMLLMAFTGLTSAGGLTCLGRAMQLAPAGMVMPFHYTQIIWGMIFGLIVFGDGINLSMTAGAGLILLSGILLMLGSREK